MLRKSFVFILLSVSTCALTLAQTAPEPRQPGEKARTMVFTTTGDGGYLGVQTKDVSKENMSQFGLNEVRGVAIEKVLENSPAASAGLMNNDVIIEFNGEKITSVRKLTRLISEVAPDHKAKVTILRNGSERDFEVTLGKREMPQFFNGNFNFENFPAMPSVPNLPELRNIPRGELPALKNFPPMGEGDEKGFVWTTGGNRQIGIGVANLTKQLGDYFGVAEGKGLLINSVREDSPAAKAGLRAGDIIVEAEGKEVKNNLDLIRAINEKKEGSVSLTIIRDKNRQTISVMPEVSKNGVIRLNGEGDLNKLLEQNPAMKLQQTTPKIRIAPNNLEILTAPEVLK